MRLIPRQIRVGQSRLAAFAGRKRGRGDNRGRREEGREGRREGESTGAVNSGSNQVRLLHIRSQILKTCPKARWRQLLNPPQVESKCISANVCLPTKPIERRTRDGRTQALTI